MPVPILVPIADSSTISIESGWYTQANSSFIDVQHSANSQLFLTFLYCLNDKLNFSHHRLIIMCFVLMSHFFKVEGRGFWWFIVCRLLQCGFKIQTVDSDFFLLQSHPPEHIIYMRHSLPTFKSRIELISCLCQHSRGDLNYKIISAIWSWCSIIVLIPIWQSKSDSDPEECWQKIVFIIPK